MTDFIRVLDRIATPWVKIFLLLSIVMNLLFLCQVKHITENHKHFKLPGKPDANSPIEFVIDHGAYDPEIHMPHSYAILQAPPTCHDVDILFAIKSIPSNAARRNALRQSWLKSSNYHGFNVRRVFLFGEDGAGVQKEIDAYGDVLVGDFVDSFHNLTFKDAMMLKWVQMECRARYIFKGDDDVFVSCTNVTCWHDSIMVFQINPFELIRLVTHIPEDHPLVYGSRVTNNPVIRDKTSKYSDFRWNSAEYPVYVSGAAFIMNYAAGMAILSQIPSTPIISIDDAYLGICLERAGHPNAVREAKGFQSYGFRDSKRGKWDVCRMNNVTYFHRFMPDEINCFWPRFIEHRHKCKDPSFTYKEEEPLCAPPLWYEQVLNQPNLALGKNRFRCGPDYDNAACPINPKDFQGGSGPCCSASYYCGLTPNHCYCLNCTDFQTVSQRKHS